MPLAWLMALCAKQFATKAGFALLWELEIVVALTCERLATQHEPHYPEGHGSGFFWELAASEHRHAKSLAILAGIDKTRTEKRFAATRPYSLGWAGLASWRYLIGPPLHQMTLNDCKKAIALLEFAQYLFYLSLAKHCGGSVNRTLGAIAAEEMQHSVDAGGAGAGQEDRLSWAIVVFLAWDYPRLKLGFWRRYGA